MVHFQTMCLLKFHSFLTVARLIFLSRHVRQVMGPPLTGLSLTVPPSADSRSPLAVVFLSFTDPSLDRALLVLFPLNGPSPGRSLGLSFSRTGPALALAGPTLPQGAILRQNSGGRTEKLVHPNSWILRKRSQPGSRKGRKLQNIHDAHDLADTLSEAIDHHEEDNMLHLYNDDNSPLHDRFYVRPGGSDFKISDRIRVSDEYVKLKEMMKLQDHEADNALTNLQKSILRYRTKYMFSDDIEAQVNESRSNFRRKLLAIDPVLPVLGDWSNWSKCSKRCGKGGVSVRRRTCQTKPVTQCGDSYFDARPCNVGRRCRAYFTSWGVWGPCSVTCGEGVKGRSRVCVTHDTNKKCRGLSSLLERCDMGVCRQFTPAVPLLSRLLKPPPPISTRYYLLQNLMSYQLSHNVAPPPPVNKTTVRPTIEDMSLRIPAPPLLRRLKDKGLVSSPLHPFLWGRWGDFSNCSSKCGIGYRTRLRLCLDNSQMDLVKVSLKWCGRGVARHTIQCWGPCEKADTGDDHFPSKIKIMQIGNKLGPRVISHYENGKELKMSRAEVVETKGEAGPNIITSQDDYKGGSISKVEIVESGNSSGPIVLTDQDPEVADVPDTVAKEFAVTPETIVFVVLFLICVVLFIISFFIYFLQRAKEYKLQKRLKEAQPFYKKSDIDDDDIEPEPVHGVKLVNKLDSKGNMIYEPKPPPPPSGGTSSVEQKPVTKT